MRHPWLSQHTGVAPITKRDIDELKSRDTPEHEARWQEQVRKDMAKIEAEFALKKVRRAYRQYFGHYVDPNSRD